MHKREYNSERRRKLSFFHFMIPPYFFNKREYNSERRRKQFFNSIAINSSTTYKREYNSERRRKLLLYVFIILNSYKREYNSERRRKLSKNVLVFCRYITCIRENITPRGDGNLVCKLDTNFKKQIRENITLKVDENSFY